VIRLSNDFKRHKRLYLIVFIEIYIALFERLIKHFRLAIALAGTMIAKTFTLARPLNI